MEKFRQLLCNKCSSRITLPPWGFKDVEEEKLYAAYTQQQRHKAAPHMLMIGVFLQVFAFIVPGDRDVVFAYTSVLIALIVNVTLLIIYKFITKIRPVLNHIIWLVVWVQLLISASRREGNSYNELLGWAVLLEYFTLATLPLHYMILLLYSVISINAYIFVQLGSAYSSKHSLAFDLSHQLLANGVLLSVTSILGVAAFIINETQQRNSFADTKQSLRDKLTIEQQSIEQERLLLSVLPEHVAVQMRKELGLIDTQFKKIYMSRHENVSILYADIVGFTAISSTYSAQDLVAILNELFARFDRLAEKYQQLRIKILGDCYYCISGAPVERSDHAVLCVHMGLSMVKAIKYVQQTTNSPVDMRVGIHTGAVLAGVLGQRQWQFDVYSRDVELANKMESSGKAGRVHVSEVTLSFLNDEFEVEPAHGERREEMLRQAGIKTYFIVRVLKPWSGGDEKSVPEGEATEGVDDADTLSDLRDDDEDSVLSPQDESKDDRNQKIMSMLQEELVNRDDDKELADATTLCLTFKAAGAEESYIRREDLFPVAISVPSLTLIPAVILINDLAIPDIFSLNLFFVLFVIESLLFNVVHWIYLRYTECKKKDVNHYWKVAVATINVVFFVIVNLIPLVVCGYFETAILEDKRPYRPILHAGARHCTHPSYYYHVAAAVACGALFASPLGVCARSVLILFVAVAHALPSTVYPAMLIPRLLVDDDPYLMKPYNATTEIISQDLFNLLAALHVRRHLIMIFLIVFVVLIYNRYVESLERARHSRSVRIEAQAAQASDLRRRNLALIHNVLPPHVVKHFMGARHHHRDLYSQSYAEVGVLFASMPNFSEFYSEETVNNQGLECLRFLNEVISDFDLLLEDSKFCKDIIKIKTISSTYMAASGLNPKRVMKRSDGVLVRWAHLACLVEFALELQRVLAAINEQSFNHFVLRLGVNHGPITAGVIGARKPHYDIWGNTVNVASRMESTGKAGCIQVTEETCEILKHFGYSFEQRGLVAVKGKGELMTYYLQNKRDRPNKVTDKNTMNPEVGPGESLLANGGAATEVKDPLRHTEDAESTRPLLQTK